MENSVKSQEKKIIVSLKRLEDQYHRVLNINERLGNIKQSINPEPIPEKENQKVTDSPIGYDQKLEVGITYISNLLSEIETKLSKIEEFV